MFYRGAEQGSCGVGKVDPACGETEPHQPPHLAGQADQLGSAGPLAVALQPVQPGAAEDTSTPPLKTDISPDIAHIQQLVNVVVQGVAVQGGVGGDQRGVHRAVVHILTPVQCSAVQSRLPV